MKKIDVVLKIVEEICPFKDINEKTELIDSGIITSLELFELVIELENKFNIEINEELIVKENFVTIEKIAEMLQNMEDCYGSHSY